MGYLLVTCVVRRIILDDRREKRLRFCLQWKWFTCAIEWHLQVVKLWRKRWVTVNNK